MNAENIKTISQSVAARFAADETPSPDPLAVTFEVDGDRWTWREVRPGVMLVPVTDRGEFQRLDAQRDRLRRAPVALVNGARMRCASMGRIEFRDGCAEFTLMCRKVYEPKAPEQPAPTKPLPPAAPTDNRRTREAPLVALVNAVPEGLDARAWRAAVLAGEEVARAQRLYTKDRIADCTAAFAFYDGGKRLLEYLAEVDAGHTHDEARAGVCAWHGTHAFDVCTAGIDAYRRAIAPQGPRPAPYRRKAPGLPLDMGEG